MSAMTEKEAQDAILGAPFEPLDENVDGSIEFIRKAQACGLTVHVDTYWDDAHNVNLTFWWNPREPNP